MRLSLLRSGRRWQSIHLSTLRKTQAQGSYRSKVWSPGTRQIKRGLATQATQSFVQFGQPVHETHPHILNPGEITPGISALEYDARRSRLCFDLPTGSLVVLTAADLQYRSGAVFHQYRQDSNFLYLTGFSEPDALCILFKTGEALYDFTFHLFVRPKDPVAEQWAGPRSGIEAAKEVFNADDAYDIREAETLVPNMLKNAKQVYTNIDHRQALGRSGSKIWNLLNSHISGQPLQQLTPYINALRSVKSKPEIGNMRRAGQLSGRVITQAMGRRWTDERQLAAFLDYGFIREGCDGPAYIPVVAGGSNGNIIHYVHNNQTLRDGDMVLVDAGGEYGTYVCDISRTWPLSGRFSAAQSDLYSAVLNVQRACVSLCHVSSRLSLDEMHQKAMAGLENELKGLGFDMSGNAISELFPHHLGHHVGLDVHDCPGMSRGTKLAAGNCITIEPGVYVPDDDRWPKHFRGMAIRIEDSVVVDDDSPFVLTTEAVKEIEDIEALRSDS